MNRLPIRSRPTGNGEVICVGDTGRFFKAPAQFATKLAADTIDAGDASFLEAEGFMLADDDTLGQHAHDYDMAQRLVAAGPLDYLILVPTLRCNLSCGYCQVSRANANASGYDWSQEVLDAVLVRIDELPGDRIKIEFQGGEPTLRPDLIEAVIARCERFCTRQFVICTNLQHIDERIMRILDREDVHVSTSLDGDMATHRANRTASASATSDFARNLSALLVRHGPGRIAALPTVDPLSPPNIDDLIDAYANRGFESIYLRPINYQGFARKRHGDALAQDGRWYGYHRAFVMRLIERNWNDQSRVLEESYLSLCLRRIFRPGLDRHVDLRNPNPMGLDYIVVDHDGRVYPTDEARMLARSGIVDLGIGDVFAGWDSEARATLNKHSSNLADPACSRCAYQPFCGRDVVDDISRYGRIDMPRHETEFCRRHLNLFDLAFELIYSDDPAVRHSVSQWLGLPGDGVELGSSLQ